MSDRGREIIKKTLREEAKAVAVMVAVILVWSVVRWAI